MTSSGNHKPIKRISFFRFYEELNDFLHEDRRKKRFPFEFTGTPSVKDTIEAIGVPHTEIDVILIDGVSVGFDYRMHGGEHVSVYPVFESFDITPLVHLRSKPLREIRFVVDVNLGKLARKLRLLGFDTLYNNNFKDEEIVKISLKERRIILTRDKGIFKYRAVTHGYWIRNNDPKDQLKEVVKRMQLENSFEPFTRCSNCNELLNPVDKELIRDRLPKLTCFYVDDFMKCKGCRKIYWKGSHYDQIFKIINELKTD